MDFLLIVLTGKKASLAASMVSWNRSALESDPAAVRTSSQCCWTIQHPKSSLASSVRRRVGYPLEGLMSWQGECRIRDLVITGKVVSLQWRQRPQGSVPCWRRGDLLYIASGGSHQDFRYVWKFNHCQFCCPLVEVSPQHYEWIYEFLLHMDDQIFNIFQAASSPGYSVVGGQVSSYQDYLPRGSIY